MIIIIIMIIIFIIIMIIIKMITIIITIIKDSWIPWWRGRSDSSPAIRPTLPGIQSQRLKVAYWECSILILLVGWSVRIS